MNTRSKNTSLKKIFPGTGFMLTAIFFSSLSILQAQRTLPTTDQFNYNAGPLQVVGLDWTRISGSGNDLLVSDGNETFNGYLEAFGRKATMTNGAADDLKLSFTGQNSSGTTVFVSFILNVINTTGLNSSGTYCFILGSGTNNFAGRIYIKISGTGYVLGVSKTSTAPVSWSSAQTVSNTRLIVLAYEIQSGTSNDIVSLWINPPITTIKPEADLSTSTGSDFGGGSSIDGFMLRQATGSPNASIDDIVISTSWSDLLRNPVYTSSGSIGTGSFSDVKLTGNTTSLTLAGNISVSGTFTLADAAIIPAGKTISFGSGGTLKYSGSNTQTTWADEFPAINGPSNLIINNTEGVILNLDRTLTGNLTVNQGSKLIINPLKALTVQGTTALNSTESLIIRSDVGGTGSFIDNGVISGPGTAKVERFLTGYTGIIDVKYHFISSPITFQPIQPGFVADPPNPGDDFYKWDEPSATWINSKSNTGLWNTGFEAAFEPGKGYLVAYPADMTKNYTGYLNTNPVGSPLVKTCSHTDPAAGGGGGWNLVGNPYPSAIDWNLVTRGNGIDNALYYYDASAENYRYYIQYQPGYSLGNGSQYIPAMQGFMVHAGETGDHTISIDNSSRVHQSMDLYYKNSFHVENILKLKVENENRSDELYILFREEAGPGFDGSYDAYKLFSMNPEVPQIYSMTTGMKELAVNAMKMNTESIVVRVGFRPGTNGSFILTAEGAGSFNKGTTIILEDMLTGTTRNLVSDPEYNFIATPGDDPVRFRIHFSGLNGIKEEANQVHCRIYASTQNIRIQPGQDFQSGIVILYNISGQELLEKEIAGPELISIPLDVAPGLYFVKVVSEGNIQIEKILF